MQLRQSESFGIFYQHYYRVRHIHADFYDNCGNKKLYLAALEFFHNLGLFRGLHLAVEQTHAVILERVILYEFIVLGRGQYAVKFTFLDKRAYYVSLPALVKMFLDVVPGPLPDSAVDFVCLYGDSALGKFVDYGDVKISVDGPGQCSRDGCRGHDEHMHSARLFLESGALTDAESVLFIGYRQTEVFKLHTV